MNATKTAKPQGFKGQDTKPTGGAYGVILYAGSTVMFDRDFALGGDYASKNGNTRRDRPVIFSDLVY